MTMVGDKIRCSLCSENGLWHTFWIDINKNIKFDNKTKK